MPVPVSSLSVAVQGIADFLDSQFGEEVNVTVAHPQRAAEIAKGNGVTAHCLNVFAYRVAPSGFHADRGMGETQFLRLNVLLTPFPAELDNAADDADMRILGHAIRVLQSHPVLPVSGPPLPAGALPDPANPTEYLLQAVMLSPPMEEVNHIWTTQGGDLAYRLSAVYEFALVPIEPLVPSETAAPPRTLVLDTAIDMEGAQQPFVEPSVDTRAFGVGAAAESDWLPVQMFAVGGALASSASVAPGDDTIRYAVTGPSGGQAAVEVVWTTPGGDDPQAPQILPLNSTVIDAPGAQHDLTLDIPAGATGATIRARPAAGGNFDAAGPTGNVLTLSVV